MSNNKFLLLTMILVGWGCTSVKAPQGTVPKRNGLLTSATGSWIEVTSEATTQISGELLAADTDSLYVLTAQSIEAFPLDQVKEAKAIMFNTSSGDFALWTFGSSVFTISNGGFLLFTFPMNLITGISTSAGEAKRTNYLIYPQTSIEEISRYSRFPQGMPSGLSYADLKTE